jgi:hypothetical protein
VVNPILLGNAVLDETEDVTHTVIVVPTTTHPSSKLLLDHWKLREKEDGFVVGKDIPSRALSSILSNLSVCELTPNGKDLRVRLAGSGLMRRFGKDVSGSCVSELYGAAQYRWAMAAAQEVLREGNPIIGDSRITRLGAEIMRTEIVYAPIYSPDRLSRWVLIGAFYFD